MPRPLRWIWLGTVGYDRAWQLQRTLAAARAAGEVDDSVLLLEHPPVYTIGRNTEPEHLGAGPAALRALGAGCVEVDRGGSVTFHGPGQLVGYPIIRLAESFPIPATPNQGDVIAYVRALEAALIGTAASHGVAATRRPGFSGAWVGSRKLAAIGVKLSKGVTQHGLALNVTTDLGWFANVVPCGISDAGVTSLAELGAVEVSPETLAPGLAAGLAAAFQAELLPADRTIRRVLAQPRAPATVTMAGEHGGPHPPLPVSADYGESQTG